MKKKESSGSEFVWPEFKSERERIKLYTQKYAHLDDGVAMSLHYGFKMKSKKSTPSIYREVHPGDLIPLKIVSIDKKNVVFDTGSFKENIVSAVNLYQYQRFKNNIPKETIMCKVVSKDHDKMLVDPIAPLFDAWLKEKLDGIPNQCDTSVDRSIEVKSLHLLRGGFQGAVEVDTVSKFCGQPVYVKAFIPGSQIVLNIERDFERWEGATVKAFISNFLESSDQRLDKMSLICSAKDYLKFQGDLNKIDMFDKYCLNGSEWKQLLDTRWDGVVTGIINSKKKQGVFVEIPDLNITGMIEMKSYLLNSYHPGMNVGVVLDKIEEPMYKDEIGAIRHGKSFVFEGSILKRCNLRITFKIVD